MDGESMKDNFKDVTYLEMVKLINGIGHVAG